MIADLAHEFRWAHDFWRRMGWRELRMWLRQLDRIRQRASGQHVTEPGSWAGSEHDAGWAELRRKRDEARGR